MDRPLALITGASRRIGRAVASRLARDGLHVVINDRSKQQATASVRDLIISEGGQAVLCQFEVARQQSVNVVMPDAHAAAGCREP